MSARCRSCGAPITWAVTTTGKRMPVDVAPTPTGNLVVEGEAVRVVASDAPGVTRYTSHFATCPNGATHRKSRANHG